MIFYYVVVGTLAVIVSILLWLKPNWLVTAAVITMIFVRTLEHFVETDLVSNADDFLVLLTVLRGAFEGLRLRRWRRFPGGGLFVLFAALGIVSGIASPDVGTERLLAGAFLALKGIAFGWAVCQLEWTAARVKVAFRVGGVLATLVLAGAVINLVIPGAWAQLFAVGGSTITRFGLPSLHSFFVHPFDLAYFASMVAIATIAFRGRFGGSWRTVLMLIGSACATVLAFRRKDILGLLASVTVVSGIMRNARWIFVAVLVLPLVIILLWDEIDAEATTLLDSYFSVDSGEARTVLLLGSVSLAASYAPLGAGFGMFGSRTAAVDYSPEYLRLGYPGVHGLGPGDRGFFLTDTAWPAIIGETGFIGAAAFALALIAVARSAVRWIGNQDQNVRMLGVVAAGWLILTLFQSTGAAVFTSPPAFGIFFALVGMGAAHAEVAATVVRTPIAAEKKGSRFDW